MNLDNPNIVPAPDANPQPIPGDIFPATMGGGQSTEPVTTTTQTQAPQKIVVGDKVFNTTEEALAYAEGFVQSQSKTTQRMAPAEAPPPPEQPRKLGTMIFENPDEALAEVENRAVERMRAEQRSIDENKKFWDDFYSKHSDLRGEEDIVDMLLAKGQGSGRFVNMTREQAAPILAAMSRERLSKARNSSSGGQALPSSPAMVAGSSGAPTPRPQATQIASTNFVSELRGMRKRG